MNTDTALSGSLQDFGLVEILQAVELGAMTGALHLKHASGRMGILYFNEGKLANCAEMDRGALTLGDILQQLGMTTYYHIEEAHRQQLQDPLGKRIGERLIMMGVLTEQQLYEALRTKALWTARELALWQEGNYEFFPAQTIQKLLTYGENPLDIDVVRVTMEMVRYDDEWQAIRKFLPQRMRTLLQMSASLACAMRFDLRTLELFTHVNLYHRVRRIATALRRPEMDVARDLAQLVQMQFIVPVQEEMAMPPPHGTKMRLPDPAEKLRLEHFELLDLISKMEQEWEKRRTPMEQLPALVDFVNWTMEALSDACRANGTELDPNTLRTLMLNENLWYMGSYEFRVEQNHIDVESFSALCNDVMGNDMSKVTMFYDEASGLLHRLLSCIFEMINSRIASPHERLENQDVWEAMFEQFALQRSES